MHRVSGRIVRTPRLSLLSYTRGRFEEMVDGPIAHKPISTISRRTRPQGDQELAPRKKSRKSTIMEALRRGTDQPNAPNSAQPMSTVASLSMDANHSPPQNLPLAHSSKPSAPGPMLAPTGLAFYTHTVSSPFLPKIPVKRVHYFRETSRLSTDAAEQANAAITQMIDRLNSHPDSRWRGVVGFDMEWNVRSTGGPNRTGLVQISDDKDILLIQVSSMKSPPSKLRDLVTSGTILKVGVNIGPDMKKLRRDFGSEYTARGVLELSHLARTVDVGLVGTKIDDLESNRASIGVGVKKDGSTNVLVDRSEALNSGSDDDVADETELITVEDVPNATRKGKSVPDECISSGRRLISLARLCRRYLGRELAKGPERISNWEQILTPEQMQYAANDAHAGLALYHALRMVHSRSISEGTIPVLSPAPWQADESLLNDPQARGSPSIPNPTTVPPPPRAITKTTTKTKTEIIPTDKLQNLTPSQLELLLPWSTFVKDLQAEAAETRTAIRIRRVNEGVDVKGRGEAVIAAEETAAATNRELARVAHPSSYDAESPPTNVRISSEVRLTPSASASDTTTPPTTHISRSNSPIPPSKGMARVLARRQAFQDDGNEALGKKWPPSRTSNSYPAASLVSSSSTLSMVSISTPSTTPPPEEHTHTPSAPKPLPRPSLPRNASSPVPGTTRPSAQHLRAYLLWHNQRLALPQICASMRSARHPLAKATVIYIVQAIQADESLPFEESRLKALVGLDLTNWVKENHRQFLESKVGPLDVESQ